MHRSSVPLTRLALASALLILAMVLSQAALASPPATSAAAEPAVAQAPSRADVEALVALEDWPGKLANLRETFAEQMRLAVDAPAWKHLPPPSRDRMAQQLAEVMTRLFAWPGDLSTLVHEIYLTHASAQDVTTLLDFYRSADGQWMVQRLQPVLDQVEFLLLNRGRQDVVRLTEHWLADERPPTAAPAAPTPWQPATPQETAAHRLLATTSLPSWSAQVFDLRLRAIERFTHAAAGLPQRNERFQGFTARLREGVSLDAYLPELVARLMQDLTAEELNRAWAIETSAPRQQVHSIDRRIGKAYGQRMEAWQREVLFPALNEVMEAAQRSVDHRRP
jgi:hypothetical protein